MFRNRKVSSLVFCNKRTLFCSIFGALVFTLNSSITQGAACVVSATSLDDAKHRYAQSCTAERKDCDPIDGLWYCSSEKIADSTPIPLPANTSPLPDIIPRNPPATAAATQQQQTPVGPCIDTDGDGWGWNGASCLVTNVEPTTTTNTVSITEVNQHSENQPTTAEISVAQRANIPATISASNDTQKTAADITDLILVTGQSNALGANTTYDWTLDRSHENVFAFTNNGWQVADLRQVWDLNWHPLNHPETDPSNNFALHFGKSVAAADESRVIGFILVTAPGMPISHWDYNGDFYNHVQAKVLDAINQLPHKSALDGILWHQGESDGEDKQYYTDKLYSLISNLRNEPWAVPQAPFICGETKIPSINNRLNGLNTDSDPTTACVAGEDLSTRADGAHFDGPALRILGARYAQAYLRISN